MRDYFAELWSFAVGCYGEKFRGGCDDNIYLRAKCGGPPPPLVCDYCVMCAIELDIMHIVRI